MVIVFCCRVVLLLANNRVGAYHGLAAAHGFDLTIDAKNDSWTLWVCRKTFFFRSRLPFNTCSTLSTLVTFIPLPSQTAVAFLTLE